MRSFVATVSGLLFRMVVVMFGLILLVSLMFAILIGMLVWGMHYGWARLRGKPVTPFVFGMGTRTRWGQFKSTMKPKKHAPADDVTDVVSRPAG